MKRIILSGFIANPARDAWATIRGYIFQFDRTIERWLELKSGEELWLEFGEDIDFVSNTMLSADVDASLCPASLARRLEQVKHRTGAITLRSPESLEALLNFAEHRALNRDLSLRYVFSTNARIGREKLLLPSQLPLIDPTLGREAIIVWEKTRRAEFKGGQRKQALLELRKALTISANKPKKINKDDWDRFQKRLTDMTALDWDDFVSRFEWQTELPEADAMRPYLTSKIRARDSNKNEVEADEQYRRLFFFVANRLSQKGSKVLTCEELETQLALPVLNSGAAELFRCFSLKLQTIKGELSRLRAEVQNVKSEQHRHGKQLVQHHNSLSEQNAQLSELRSALTQSPMFSAAGFSASNPLEVVHFILNGQTQSVDGGAVTILNGRKSSYSTQNGVHFFLGRENDFKLWNELALSGGYMLLTAPAGGGKSTALTKWDEMLRVRTLRQESPPFVVSQFFKKPRDNDYWSGMMMLAEQLLVANQMQGQLHQRETVKIQTTVRLLLQSNYQNGLVVILDGLDEAKVHGREDENWLAVEFLRDALPERLGQGVCVVLSLRAIEGESTKEEVAQMLALPNLHHYPLPPLGIELIEEWLRIVLEKSRANVPEDLTYQAHQIHYRTQGNPLYLYHLMDQLHENLGRAPGKPLDWKQIIHELPLRFEEYVQTALSVVVKNHAAWRDALRFVALARSPLSENDLLILTQESGNPLQPEDWSAIPWEIRRWLLPYNPSQDEFAFSSTSESSKSAKYWVFSHAAIGEAFMGGDLRKDLRESIHLQFAEFCRCWQKHHSLYALRHLPDHLLEIGDWSGVYSLIEDKEFYAAVVRGLPDDPDPRHRMEHVGLEAALQADDAERITKFLLAYQSKFRHLCWMHPLRVLYRRIISDEERKSFPPSQISYQNREARVNDLQLRRAWRTADLYPIDESVLWHLLLATQLFATQEWTAGLQTLERLKSQQGIQHLQNWQEKYGIYLLEDVFSFLQNAEVENVEGIEKTFYVDIALELGRIILSERALLDLAQNLALKGDDTNARLLISGCQGWRKCQAIVRLAKWNATSNPHLAFDYLQTALDSLDIGEDRFDDAWALTKISLAWCDLGDFGQAFEVISKIQDWEDRITAYGNLAISMDLASKKSTIISDASSRSQVDHKLTLTSSFTQWQDLVIGSIEDPRRNGLLREICVAWAKIGLHNNALMLKNLLPEEEHSSAMHKIIGASILRGDFDTALQQINASPEDRYSGDLLKQLGLELFEKGKIDQAKETFLLARKAFEMLPDEDEDDVEGRGRCLADLCEVQAKKGFISDAKDTAFSINRADWRLGWVLNEAAFTAIVLAQADAGDIDGAYETLELMPINKSGAVAGVLFAEMQRGELHPEFFFHSVEHICRRAKEHGAPLALEMAKLCREEGLNKEAYDVMSRAVAEPEELSHSWQARSESLATIAKTLIENQEIDEVKVLLRLAVESSLEYPLGTGYFHDIRLIEIARLQISCLAIEDATETALAMDSEHAQNRVLSHIEALEKAPQETPPFEHFDYRTRETDDAGLENLTLEDLVLRAQNSEDIELSGQLWGRAALMAIELGEKENAFAYWQHAIDRAMKMSNEWDRDSRIVSILQDQVHCGYPDEALETGHLLLTNNFFDYHDFLVTICQEYWKQNRKREAVETLHQVESIFSQVEAICRFSLWQFHAGSMEQAHSILKWLINRLRAAELKWNNYSIQQIGVTAAKVGLGEDAVELALALSVDRDVDGICAEIAEALVIAGDIKNWKRLVAYCADLKIAPWAICGQIALAYPSEAKQVGEVLQRHTPKW